MSLILVVAGAFGSDVGEHSQPQLHFSLRARIDGGASTQSPDCHQRPRQILHRGVQQDFLDALQPRLRI